MLLPICVVYYTVHTVSLSVSLCVFVLLFFLLQGDKSLIPGGLLGARSSDASQNNNIQGEEFYNIPSLLVLKPLDIALLIFIHIASSVFFGCTSTKIHHGKKVFSLRRILP